MAVRADITLSIDGAALGILRAASLSMQLGLVAAAAEEVYGWEERLPAVLTWAAQGAFLVPMRGSDDTLYALQEAQAARSTVAAVVDFGDEVETGTAIIQSLSMAAGVGGALEGSITLTGTGALTAS